VKERQAFGGRSRQAGDPPKLADLATMVESGRWLTYAACLKFATGRGRRARDLDGEALHAEMVNRVAYDCVQLYGGTATCASTRGALRARRAFDDHRGGTSEIMRDIIAKAVLK